MFLIYCIPVEPEGYKAAVQPGREPIESGAAGIGVPTAPVSRFRTQRSRVAADLIQRAGIGAVSFKRVQ